MKLSDFIQLLYPQVCAACGNKLLHVEKGICMSCLVHLPKTQFHLQNFNPLRKLLKGRLEVENVVAMYYFHKHSKVQNLLHAIKYQNAKQAALVVGEWYGYDLQKNADFKEIDIIVPVPLHPEKLKKRGYNQSALFAEGIQKAMSYATLSTTDLIRTIHNESQTKKSRIARIENIENVFQLQEEYLFKNKNVLLVDDVITTGATIEACGKLLHDAGIKKLYIATIACAIKV